MRTLQEIQRQEGVNYHKAKTIQQQERLSDATCSACDRPKPHCICGDPPLGHGVKCAREVFEAWITAPPFEKIVERWGENDGWPGQYKDIDVELAWSAWWDSRIYWQNSRNQELEKSPD